MDPGFLLAGSTAMFLDGCNVFRLQAFRPLLHLKLHGSAFVQAFVTAGSDR